MTQVDAGTIYLIDPDEAVHDALSALLDASGLRVMCFSTAEAFLAAGLPDNSEPGILLVEASLSGIGALALVRHLHIHAGWIPVVVLTSTSDRRISRQALRAGASEVIEKPLVGDRLLGWLRSQGYTVPDNEANSRAETGFERR